MIKALAGDTMIFGLTEENVQRLKGGEVMSIDFATMGHPKFTKIDIVYAPNNEALMNLFSPYINENTHISGKEH